MGDLRWCSQIYLNLTFMLATTYLPHATTLNPKTYFDKPTSHPITAYHQGKCYRYEGRYSTCENEWKQLLSKIAVLFLKLLKKQEWIDKLPSCMAQSLVHTYREIPAEELWDCVENKEESSDLYDHTLMDWDPKTHTFSVEQKADTPAPKQWIFQKDLEKYVLVVIPPAALTKKRKKQLTPFLQGYYAIIPLTTDVKSVNLRFNAAGRLQLTY